MKKTIILMSILCFSLFIGSSGCSKAQKQKGDSWEQDMNKLIDKSTPKEGGK